MTVTARPAGLVATLAVVRSAIGSWPVRRSKITTRSARSD
jgi:hypothetical protein